MSLLFVQTCEYLLQLGHLFWADCSDISSQLGEGSDLGTGPGHWCVPSSVSADCLTRSLSSAPGFVFGILYLSVFSFSLLDFFLYIYWLSSKHPTEIFIWYYFCMFLFEGINSLIIVMISSFSLCKIFLGLEFFSNCTFCVLEKTFINSST